MHQINNKVTTRSITVLFSVSALLFSGLALAGGDAGKGKALYGQQCVSCHGENGKGDGAAAAALDPKPANFTNKAFMAGLKDQQIFDAIKNGGASVGKSPLMPPFGSSLNDENIHDVVAFLRSLGK